MPVSHEAAISGGVPGLPFRYQTELKLLKGRAETEPNLVAENRFVSTIYFQTMHIPLLAGGTCRETEGPPSVVVSRAFAYAYFNRASVIGHRAQPVGLGYSGPAEIVGISGAARESGLDHPPILTAYWCAPVAQPGTYFLLRTHYDPMSMAIRRQLRDLDPMRSAYDFALLEQHFQLQREVGLRLALRVPRGQIVKRFLWQGLVVCLAGCLAGFALAVASTRLLAGLLYGVSPHRLSHALGRHPARHRRREPRAPSTTRGIQAATPSAKPRCGRQTLLAYRPSILEQMEAITHRGRASLSQPIGEEE